MREILILMLIIGCVSTDAMAKKKLYKWTDDKGRVHYSDRMPAKQIIKKHEEISDHGVVLERVGNARTAEEVLAEREKRKQKIAADKEAEKQKKIRENIIKAYTSEKEIIRLKEERLFALQRNIELANQSLDFQNTSKEQLLSIAADNERNGMEVSKALKSRIKIIDEKMEYQNEFIIVKEKEIEKVKEKFINDIKIYKEAKGTSNN